jgi:single-stranded-DNA-specific exonuclease
VAFNTLENREFYRIIKSHQFKPAKVYSRFESDDAALEVANKLATELNVSLVLAKILVSRGIDTVELARGFLSPTLKDQLPEPNQIKNIVAAAQLLLDAIEAKKIITVFTDFDVDGLSAGSQLIIYLKSLGALVKGYTPNRFTEGYGLSVEAVEKIAKSGTQVLVTVDCGISNVKEIERGKYLGLEIVVVDHHHPHQLPPADVIVDPEQEDCPFKPHKLAAAGLVWMLLIVIRQEAKNRPAFAQVDLPDPKDFLDLAALGTICDMVPLVSVNRIIAHRGVEALCKSIRPGIVALREVSGITGSSRVSAGQVSFSLGPRINAAGRLSDAKQILEMFTTNDLARAHELADAVNRLNSQRRGVEEKVVESCLDLLGSENHLLEQSGIALFGEDFHAGVIGIAAQRLVEFFHRPATVMCPGETVVKGKKVKVIKGSVRGIKGFNVVEALAQLGDLLIGFGGHEQAGGFSVSRENFGEFQQGFINLANELLNQDLLVRRQAVDVFVSFDQLDFSLVEQLSMLAPFGIGNPSPVLATLDVVVESVAVVGTNHLKFRLKDGKSTIDAIAWKAQGHPLIRKGEIVNVAYSPEINSYKGISSLQLVVKEVWKN